VFPCIPNIWENEKCSKPPTNVLGIFGKLSRKARTSPMVIASTNEMSWEYMEHLMEMTKRRKFGSGGTRMNTDSFLQGNTCRFLKQIMSL